MYIKIKEKIEKINNQPEHVRMRYVWGCVAVSLFVIFIVWIFSIISMFRYKQNAPANNNGMADMQEQFQNLKEQGSALKSLSDQSINESDMDQKNMPGSAYSSQENSASEIPESDSYSRLPNPNTSTSTQQ